MQIQLSQLPEGTVISFATVNDVNYEYEPYEYEKREDGWVRENYFITDNELIGLEEVGAVVDIKVKSWPKPVEINENTSDGYHTFKELYEMRMLLTAVTFNLMALRGYKVVRSKTHSDGTIPFNDPNWFIVVAELPGVGQISYHYEMKDWDLFMDCAWDTPPAYDGHMSADVAERLRKFLNSMEW